MMIMERIIKDSLQEAVRILDAFVSDPQTAGAMERAVEIFAEALLSGGKIISCGNGG